MSFLVDTVKRDAHETRLWDVSAVQAQFDRPARELDSFQVGRSSANTVGKTSARAVARSRTDQGSAPGLTLLAARKLRQLRLKCRDKLPLL